MEAPPENPVHRSLWAMGYDAKQRAVIIQVCAAYIAAGIDASPVALGQALMGPIRIDNLKVDIEGGEE